MSTELTRTYVTELKSIIESRDDSAALEKLDQLWDAAKQKGL